MMGEVMRSKYAFKLTKWGFGTYATYGGHTNRQYGLSTCTEIGDLE